MIVWWRGREWERAWVEFKGWEALLQRVLVFVDVVVEVAHCWGPFHEIIPHNPLIIVLILHTTSQRPRLLPLRLLKHLPVFTLLLLPPRNRLRDHNRLVLKNILLTSLQAVLRGKGFLERWLYLFPPPTELAGGLLLVF